MNPQDNKEYWGEEDNWLQYMPAHDHVEWYEHGEFFALIVYICNDLSLERRAELRGEGATRAEARIKAIQKFVAVESQHATPWKEVDLSTEEKCRAVILSCGYRILANIAPYHATHYPLSICKAELGVRAVRFGDEEHDGWPTLRLWQQAARHAMADPVKENE